MTTTQETTPPGVGPDEADRRQRNFPPVARLGTLTLALTVAGGVVMAANYGKAPSLVAPIALTAAAGAVLIVNVILLARAKEFAWTPFFRVLGWTLLAYLTIAGILEFVFVFDHTPAHQLALFSVLLFLFATDVPLVLAFSVARWQIPAEAA
jgi:hypothetical protein